MKKLASIILALTLVMGMSTVSFAEETKPTPSTATELNFTKSYKTTAGETPAVFPSETLKFEVTAKDGNPDNTMITIADHSVTGNPDNNVVISVPAYNNVGKWNYTIKEKIGNTQGVTYTKDGQQQSFDVQVLVTYSTENSDQLVSQIVFSSPDGNEDKIDEIVNIYDLGSLTIDKNVDGNLASKTQKFDIDVVFTSNKPVLSAINGVTKWTENNGVYTSNTVTFSLAHGDNVATVANIPAGVTYKVVEQSKHTEADVNGSAISKGYTVTYDKAEGTIAADTTSAAVVTNTKGTTVDTGIGMDSLPYMLLLAFAFAGMVVFFAKKRFSRAN